MTMISGGCFLLYEHLLSNNAQAKWSIFFSSQTKAAPWTNLNSCIHKMACKKTMQAFEDCITFHLLTIFPKDAAEQQWYNINMSLKKPGKVTIQNFETQVEQLNSYPCCLPGIINSPKAIKKSKHIEPFDEPNLAQLILKMCPLH